MAGTLGRPTKRTPEVEKKILDLLRVGNPRKVAASCAGIHADTLYEWMREFSDFYDAVTRAEDEATATAVASIKRASLGERSVRTTTKRLKDSSSGRTVEDVTTIESVDYDWRAAAWYLERRRPEDFRERKTVDMQVAVEMTQSVLTAAIQKLSELVDAGLPDGMDRDSVAWCLKTMIELCRAQFESG